MVFVLPYSNESLIEEFEVVVESIWDVVEILSHNFEKRRFLKAGTVEPA